MGSSYDESSDSECEDSGDEMVDDEPVGGRRIEDFYVIGKQIGKYVNTSSIIHTFLTTLIAYTQSTSFLL